MLSTLIHKQWRFAQTSVYIHLSFDHDVIIKYHLGASSVISDQASMYSLVSFFSAVATFPVKQMAFKIFIIFVDITLSFLLGSKNKNKFGEIDIFRLQFPLIKLWEVILKSVNYGKYTALNMVLLLHLIG